MAVLINASTSAGLQITSDTSGLISFQTNGTQFNPLLTAGTSQASTSGTSIDFTSIPSWVKRITVMFAGVSTSGTSDMIVQLGTGATPTYTTSGYNGRVATQTGGTVSSFTSGFMYSMTPGATDTISGQMIISNLTGNTWVESSTMAIYSVSALRYGAGHIALAATLTAVRITMANGTDTFDAGSINILYE